jgi:Zn-dependent protease
MIPFPPLDGSKVKAWDTKVWVGVIVAALAMMNLA